MRRLTLAVVLIAAAFVSAQTDPASGPLQRLAGANGQPWLFANSQSLGDTNAAHHQFSKFGGGFIQKFGPSDYRTWAEGVAQVKTIDPTNQPGVYDYDTGAVYGTSADGVTWSWRDLDADGSYDYVLSSLSPTNPPNGSKTWMHGQATIDWVIFDADAGIYKAWGHAGNNSGPIQIFYATSPDGITNWTFQNGGQPIIRIGASGSWDDHLVAAPRVFKVGPSDYRMYFKGIRQSDARMTVGYATSLDGVTWTPYANNPVLVPTAAWEGNQLFTGFYAWDGSVIHAWYAAGTNTTVALGYASAPDWITFTKGANNPVLLRGTPGSLDEDGMTDWVQGYIDNGTVVIEYQGHDFTPMAPLVPTFRGSLRAVLPGYTFTFTPPDPCVLDPFRLLITKPVDPTATWAPGLDSRGCLPVTSVTN